MVSPAPLHQNRQQNYSPATLSPTLATPAVPTGHSAYVPGNSINGPEASSGQDLETARRLVDELMASNALPYERSVRWAVREQLAFALQAYRGLRLKSATFTHNDGRQAQLLQLEGTIPMWYKGVKYNIPITAWLLEAFPQSAPLVYVTPTRDMVIRPRHAHVDASGLVDVPALREWGSARSSLVDLLESLSVMFGHQPPLFSRGPPAATGGRVDAGATQAAAAASAEQSARQARQVPNPMSGGAARGPQMGADGRAGMGAAAAGSGTGGAESILTETPEAAFKRLAVAVLKRQLEADAGERLREAVGREETQLGLQQVLAKRQEGIIHAVQNKRREKEALEEALQVYQTNAETLEEWLLRNEAPAGSAEAEDVDADEGIEPAGPLARQLLECVVADLAIEDTLYALDRAVHEDGRGMAGSSAFHSSASLSAAAKPVVSVDQYLRTVRALSREQFFHRATALQVQAVQRSNRVAQMATGNASSGLPVARRAPGY